MTNILTLYRPIGLKEYELIEKLDFRAFPPRLDWQPILYPVLNYEYAVQIARNWNTRDAASDYIGFVTAFDVDAVYLSQFEEQVDGGSMHRELWIPAERLGEFNAHIVEQIRILAIFYGDNYNGKRDFMVDELQK